MAVTKIFLEIIVLSLILLILIMKMISLVLLRYKKRHKTDVSTNSYYFISFSKEYGSLTQLVQSVTLTG